VPAHKQKMFAASGADVLRLPVTDQLSEKVISLPMHSEFKEEQLDYIINKVSEFFKINP
jgi:dTDP-4-amino-4,6-dideoxygalactose transaminase